MEEYFKIILVSIFSGAVVASVISIIFKRKTEKITAEIKNQFEMNLTSQKSGHVWKEKAVSELYGPLYLHFSRTNRAIKRYREKNLFLEEKVMKESNEKIRNLLLEKSYLILPDLFEDANNLVEHYDVWLEEFSKLRETENPEVDKKFVFAGPQGYPYPKNSEKNFIKKYVELWNSLYQ